MKDTKVLILLAAYNGDKFLPEMIDSVLAQDHENLQLVLSDDNSTDGSLQILEDYAARCPDRVIHYRSGERFGCAQKHFMHLLRKFHDAPYIMFCDQDDVWHPDKVSKTLALMRETETDPSRPVMVHTDLRVVDGQLNEIAPSFCARSGLDGSRLQLNSLLVQNVVTGCTMMLNRTLAALGSRETDLSAVKMHDWYLALIASAIGSCAFLEEATIDYRQHGSNSVGSSNVRSLAFYWKSLTARKVYKSLMGAADQAQALLDALGDVLPPESKALLTEFAKTRSCGLFRRNQIYLKNQFLKQGTTRIAAQLLGL